ncbi:S-layer homology domain-containing protein [Anaerotalea alkaliphila]|uniref:S-layer homology domain-containing protein n=1 Tax=Anaerotalea alkaliphila TaxID=2662126 RepID=A0A7X5KLJ4_9FIRM|nr:S-layer homology domain-containing protein [Anaerotalea alkaliphila]NDL66754.1 S-layer homology domain-containing protein [Anaerotalea alkaliphila]
MQRKRMAVMILALVLLLHLVAGTADAATQAQEYAGAQLRTLDILRGYEDGSLRLDNPIVRGEVATMVVRALGYEDKSMAGSDFAFKDVPASYWGYRNVQNAYKLKVVQGYPDGTFRPGNHITYAEVVALMVNALGEGGNLTGSWPENYLNKAKALGVIPGNSAVNPSKIVTRGEMAVIVWDSLLVKKN